MPRVAVIISFEAQEFCRSMLRGITRFANAHGAWEWEVFLVGSGETKRINTRNFDGVIVDAIQPTAIRKWESSRLPVVQVFSNAHSFSVSHDEQQIGAVAAEHLCALAKPLATLENSWVKDPNKWWRERVSSFCQSARNQGKNIEICGLTSFPPRPATFAGKWTPEPHIVRWVESLQKPVSIFCADIHLAREALAVCRLLKLSVPEEVSVLGVDDDELLCLMERPTLSVVITQPEKVGYHAAELLDQRIISELQSPRQRLLIPPTGVADRGSTRPDLSDDAALSKALSLIQENAAQPLNIDQIARSVGVSRRSLELRFQKQLGRSPHQELVRIRLEKAKALLVSTSLPLGQISERCGFGDPYNFSRAFRRETGTSPREHRLKHAGTHVL